MEEKELAPGITMLGFETQEEMDSYLFEQEMTAIASALDAQWLIEWGHYVIRFVDNLVIFGEIYTQEQILDGATSEEAYEELRLTEQKHDLGYRYGKWYSRVEPDGEYGSAHVCSLWPITRAEFTTARSAGWTASEELIARIYQEIAEAMPDGTRL